MFQFIILLFVSVSFVKGGFFDFTEIDDPLSVFWHTKEPPSTLNQKYGECITQAPDSTIKYGVCTHPSVCLLSGGKPNIHSQCSFLTNCCTYERSCGKRTKAKVSYFSSGSDAFAHSNCDFTVQLANNNICQIRLDFDVFRLNPPVLNDNVYDCSVDYLRIIPNTYNIPTLCGNNDKQHVYIHVQPSNTKEVNLSMVLGARSAGFLTEPFWKIKVTQLDCPGSQKYIDYNVGRDFEQLAPLGAVQYFTKSNGDIRSFSFDALTKLNNYPNGISYTIAFKRGPSICGVRLTTNYINFALYPNASAPYTDKECSDYLFVPELTFIPPEEESEHTLISKVCLTNIDGSVSLISKPPGPLYIHFVSGPHYVESPAVYGFNMKYSLIPC